MMIRYLFNIFAISLLLILWACRENYEPNPKIFRRKRKASPKSISLPGWPVSGKGFPKIPARKYLRNGRAR